VVINTTGRRKPFTYFPPAGKPYSMAWVSFDRVASTTLNGAAAVAMLAGVFALGVGIGSDCRLLMIAAGGVIFIGGLVPSVVDCRDAKRRHVPTVWPKAPPTAMGWGAPEWDMENIERESGGRLVGIEPERYRLH
jgi:hypothetical protein